jgi:predicted PurR-regulated permease PerM
LGSNGAPGVSPDVPGYSGSMKPLDDEVIPDISAAAPSRPIPWATIWAVIGSVLLTGLGLLVVGQVERVLIWLVIAVFLAVVLNPAVDFLVGRARLPRALATGVVFLGGLLMVAGLLFAFIRPLVVQGRQFADDLPSYVEDARAGRGPVGGLVRRYDIDERLKRSRDEFRGFVDRLGSQSLRVLGAVGHLVAGTLTVLVVAFLMLLEAPRLMAAGLGALSPPRRERIRRVAGDCSRAVTGYMAGNLFISMVAGVLTYALLLVVGVPFRGVLSLWVAFADLIPLVGATLGAAVVIAVAFLGSTGAGIAAIVFFIVYQQFENHVLQPVIQSRTVSLSPLVVLVSVLLGVELAGILGALFAIPVAGVMHVIARDLWDTRRGRNKAEATIGSAQVPTSRAEEPKDDAAFVTLQAGKPTTASDLAAAPERPKRRGPPG